MQSSWVRAMLLVGSLVVVVACGGGVGSEEAADVAGGPPKDQPAPPVEPATSEEPDDPGEEAAASAVIEGPTLQEYLDADTRHGFFTLTTTYEEDDRVLVQTGEVWLAGDRFRYDLYEDEVFIRSIQTPDGELAYFVNEAEQRSVPSNSTVENYLRRFLPPPVEAVDDGVDEETGAQRRRYPIQETYRLEGSPNPWHAEDLVFLLEDDRVIGLVSTGWVPRDDGSRGQIVTNRMLFRSLKVQEEIDPGLFELAYPIG
jgi:hypothetical protein